MAKKIRFPLKINGADVRTIEELRENFDLEGVLGYFANGKLVIWLRDRYYNGEADAIENLSSADEKLGFVFVCLFRVIRVSIHTAKCPFIVQTNNEYLLRKISWYIR